MTADDLREEISFPPQSPLPLLFDDSLAIAMAPYRKFRHIVHHSYGFQMDWERMGEGMARIGDIFDRFRMRLDEYLQTI